MQPYIYYLISLVGITVFVILLQKFSPTRSLIIALINIVYGMVLLTNISTFMPNLIILLVVAGVLIAFGVQGFILWFKMTDCNFKDQCPDTTSFENWWNTIKTFNMILIVGLALRFFVIQPFIVQGPSMNNNFQDGETILVDKITFNFRQPIRGEVVIFKAPNNPQDDYIKRVIGLPGDTVKIEKGKVYVNNKLIDESFLSESGKTPNDSEILTRVIGTNEYFVLGDNRPDSSDSREWGTVPKANLIGRAIIAIWPIDMTGLIKTPQIYPY